MADRLEAVRVELEGPAAKLSYATAFRQSMDW